MVHLCPTESFFRGQKTTEGGATQEGGLPKKGAVKDHRGTTSPPQGSGF
jgi:hypothetical protein